MSWDFLLTSLIVVVSPGTGVDDDTRADPRPSGIPKSEGTESTCRKGVCTTTK